MCRENRSSSDAILGRDIWDHSHRHCFRHGVHSTISSIYTIQYNQTADSGHTAAARGLLYKTTIVNPVQCPHTACFDIIVQYSDVFEGSLRTYRRGDRDVSARDSSRLRGD